MTYAELWSYSGGSSLCTHVYIISKVHKLKISSFESSKKGNYALAISCPQKGYNCT